MTARTIMNLEYLREICGGNQAVMDRLLEIFREQMPQLLEEMRGHYNKGAWDELSKSAHKAKSSVALLGMQSAKENLSFVERHAEDPSRTLQVSQCVENVFAACERVLQELNDGQGKEAA